MSILDEIINQEEFNLQESLEYINKYEQLLPFDSKIHTARAVTYFFAGDYEKADVHIRKALKCMPTNCDNNLYLANILMAQGQYVDAFKAAVVSLAFSKQFGQNSRLSYIDKCVQDVFSYCSERITSMDELNELEKFTNIAENRGSFFPEYICGHKQTIFCFDYLYKDISKKYNDYVCFYPEVYSLPLAKCQISVYKSTHNYNLNFIFPIESFKALSTREFSVEEGRYIIPIATTNDEQSISFVSENEVINTPLHSLAGVFRYYKIDKPIKLISEKDIIVGKPIKLGINKKKKKLVLNIFLDSLSQSYLTDTNYDCMPYTKEFFSKGTIFKNCYSTSEWTHPSLASIFTGLYTTNHHIIYRSGAYKFPEELDTFSEIAKKGGYFTGNITGSIGMTPYIGGFRGFDRTVLKSSEGFSDTTLINDAIDHIEAFKDTNQFVFLSLFDLHRCLEDVVDVQNNFNIVQQTSIDFTIALSKIDASKSVRQNYHEATTKKYNVAIKETDRHLKMIYDYILKNYSEDEYIISIFSDHGVSCLDKDNFLLKKGRINTSLMMRGSGIPNVECNEYLNHMDLIPIVSKLSNIDYDFSEHDCVLPRLFEGKGRNYTYTESIYQGQTYKAVINNHKYYYIFETKNNTDIDGSIDVSQYEHHIFDRKTHTEIVNKRLLAHYEKIVYEHIKKNIKY